jgi:hypothetical protein
MSDLTTHLLNVRVTEEVCTCPAHNNELIQQIDARLVNGKAIRILLDSHGYHLVIGTPGIPAGTPCPAGISRAEAERILRNER